MIKIQIDNPAQKKQEYLDAILNNVASRVKILQKSLSHLNGNTIDFSDNDLGSFRPITNNIISVVGDKYIIPTKRVGYTSGITTYRSNTNSLANINLNGLIDFCNQLVADDNQILSDLLVCEADELMNLNNTILNNNGLNTPLNINVIKLAFDYSRYDAKISSRIKTYFRTNKFVEFCPYCNTKLAWHIVNPSGEVVESFELDHFYDKATFPLLAYSFFNLVPSDHTCNVTDKSGSEFTDEYHINPYLNGYIDVIKFIPIGWNTNKKVDRIDLNILEARGTVLYKKINGDNSLELEQGVLGNLNVFKIRSKHFGNTHLANTVLKNLDSNNSYLKHLKKYLQKLNGLNLKHSYKTWYEEELNVRFCPSNFNNKAYSKFCRDIHDYYYSVNETRFNKYITELISEH